MPEIFKVITLTEALKILQKHLPKKEKLSETVPLLEGLGRIAIEDVASKIDVPNFNRSTMDGYAVKAADTFGASEAMPVYLTLIGEIVMGEWAGELELRPGTAVKIATGGMLPSNSDAVVMMEYVENLDSETIAVVKPVDW